MTYILHNDVDMYETSSFSDGSGTALLTPDSETGLKPAPKDPWSDNSSLTDAMSGSDFSISTLVDSPWCAKGDDLDDDEAYFLEDEDDDDDDYEEDYDDDDEDEEGDETESDTDPDDEDL